MVRSVALVLSVPLVAGSNPLGKVIELMDDCAAKVQADKAAEEKAYKEYFEWCDDVAKNSQFEIKTAKASKEALEAKIAEFASSIHGSNTQIEKLAEAISTDDKELAEATEVRNKESADFSAAEAELVDDIDTLDRAIGVLEREMAKNPAAFAQLNGSNGAKLAQALGAIVDAAGFSGNDKTRLSALIQNEDSSADDDMFLGAPAAATYKSHSSGIVDVLGDLKEKAEGELSDLRKAETEAKHNFSMLKQSLEDSMKADNTDLDQEKSALAAAEEGKATAEGDLSVTTKDLATAEEELATASSECMQVAADHEATVQARDEELAVIAKAKQILEETSSGAQQQTYSFLEISSRVDLKNSEVVTLIKNLARKERSAALAQLASRISAVAKYGVAAGEDPFAKIKGLISDMITKLEKEADEDATEKAYCDEEMAKTEAKKADLEATIEKLTSKIDQDVATSTQRKAEVKDLQARLAALSREQVEMDSIRAEEHADYIKAKEDLELGLSGVQKALGVLRDYYGGAAFLQQPAKPEKFSKSGGAGQGIIDILEVVESDFSTTLAKTETEEADSAANYEKQTQQNKIMKTTMEQDAKYKNQEAVSLDKNIAELSSDKETTNTELSAVLEYYSKLKDRCVAKPETYEERKARRAAEIAGLKEALSILENETAFVQRRHRGLRGAAMLP